MDTLTDRMTSESSLNKRLTSFGAKLFDNGHISFSFRRLLLLVRAETDTDT